MAAASEGAGSRCEKDILWVDGKKDRLRFVPARCLAGIDFSSPSAAADLSALPLDEASAQTLVSAVEGARILKREAALKGEPPPCFPRIYYDTFRAPADPGSLSFADLAIKGQLAVVGRVVAATPGYSTSFNRPVTFIRVEVEEVLHDRTNAVGVGSAVTYLQLAGSFDIGEDATLCWEDRPGFFWAEPGQQVLLFGDDAPDVNEGFVALREVFPVQRDEVVPQPYQHLKAEQHSSLRSLRESIARKTQGHE